MGGAEQANGTGGGSMEGLKSVLGMILVQTGFAGMNIFYKLAIDDGMDLRILTAYRYAFATVFLVPLAFILERYVLRYLCINFSRLSFFFFSFSLFVLFSFELGAIIMVISNDPFLFF
jgi:hypothetical protein